jgi:hypothetical protein
MAGVGIDISGYRSKHLIKFLEQPLTTVITVCGNADQACPNFPGSRTAITGRSLILPKPMAKPGNSELLTHCQRRDAPLA